MRVLNIDTEYYLYPKDIKSQSDFARFLNNTSDKFIFLKKLLQERCAEPYFISEDIKEVVLNINNINEFSDAEVVVMENEAYEQMLENVKKKLCKKCEYKDDCEDLREVLCLNGTCISFCEE